MNTKYNYLKSINADYIDELFERYQSNPESVDSTWRYFFEGIELGESNAHSNGHANGHAVEHPTAASASFDPKELGAARFIMAFRAFGKRLARVNPLFDPPTQTPELELSRFGLSEADLSRTFVAGSLLGLGSAPLNKIIERLKSIYSSTIGFEIDHIENNEERDWIRAKVESGFFSEPLPAQDQKHILHRLTQAECFERFLHTRYVAQKRFSIEGGDSMIPALDAVFEKAAAQGATDFVIGMAHRGRLNVLANVLGKPVEMIFTEFEGTYQVDVSVSEGDVKYHMGYSSDTQTRHGKPIHLSLAFNPSHLEFVNPVVEGVARAKQLLKNDRDGKTVVPVLIHGDAAFAGQGVCYETVNMSKLDGYQTGGTIHFVINNQVGFTTDPGDARSTRYCTDLMKMLEAPIFHVNGDDPEALWKISEFSAEYRQKFAKDVIVDVVCYRKHGHNEGDEPAFTQPLLYQKIKAHVTPREVYSKRLVESGRMDASEPQTLVDRENERLGESQTRVKATPVQPKISVFEGPRWKDLKRATETDIFAPAPTAVSAEKLLQYSEQINSMPQGFHLHSKLGRLFEGRHKAVIDAQGIDWGNAEMLAYASLLEEGTSVRISGQDVGRGTFSHRHAVVTDTENGKRHIPVNHIRPNQAMLQIHNSLLSETAVLGFEYGYSLADPSALVIWEAQFGDFANGAQVIIDQFLAAAESKWQRMSGLTLLLPHGYEGQGPEHSSARLERFLTLCGRNNIQVCNLSTPAQVFHALRRQVRRPFRKPLVIMSPKSLLRHPAAVSSLEELSKQGFKEVLDDAQFSDISKAARAERVLLCSGKVYYDLLQEREIRKLEDKVAIVRIEQLYPWPKDLLASILARYPSAQKYVWTQEEPRNMGAWTFLFNRWAGGIEDFQTKVGGKPIHYAGREVAASPAVGSAKIHEKEQKALLEHALTG